jgi:hypothetical protein
LLAQIACATTPKGGAAPAAPASAAADQVRRMFERELTPLAPLAFETPSGVKGTVEAKAAPQVTASGKEETLVVAIGTAQPISCTVFPERIDAGATIWRLVDKIRGSLEVLSARPVEVAAVAGSAVVFGEIVYRTSSEKGPVVGQVKVGVQPHETHSLLCLHDEPGYTVAFRRIVKGLAGSLASGAKDVRTEGRFAEILLVKVGEIPVGYAERVIWETGGGGRESLSWTAQLLPRTPSELVALDGFTRDVSDAAGLLLEKTSVNVQNGEVESRFTVKRGKGRKTFTYEGEKAGKALKGTFKAKAGLATELWFARQLDAKRGDGRKAELRHETYNASGNPIAATPMSLKRDAAEPKRAVMTLGEGVTLTGELDEHGLFTRAEMPMGPATFVFDRVWSRGAP